LGEENPVLYEDKRNPMTSILGNFVTLALDAVSGKISPQNPDLLKYQFLMLNLMCKTPFMETGE
jgi:hypothetical protein